MLQTQALRMVVEHGRAVGVEIASGGDRTPRTGARRARGDRLLGRDRLAQAAAAVGHRTGRPSARGRRERGPRPARRRRQPAGPSGPVRHRRVHRRPHLRQVQQAAPCRVGRPAVSAAAQGAGGLQPVRDRRLLVRGRTHERALARHPVPPRPRLGHRGRRGEDAATPASR